MTTLNYYIEDVSRQSGCFSVPNRQGGPVPLADSVCGSGRGFEKVDARGRGFFRAVQTRQNALGANGTHHDARQCKTVIRDQSRAKVEAGKAATAVLLRRVVKAKCEQWDAERAVEKLLGVELELADRRPRA